MKRNSTLAILAAAVTALTASTAFARPPEAGDWDPRFPPPVLVTDRPAELDATFNWWTASFSERKRFLQTKYAVPPKAAAKAAMGGMPLSRVDGQGRGAFVTPRSLGMSIVVQW